jgi:hypothetical protein
MCSWKPIYNSAFEAKYFVLFFLLFLPSTLPSFYPSLVAAAGSAVFLCAFVPWWLKLGACKPFILFNGSFKITHNA